MINVKNGQFSYPEGVIQITLNKIAGENSELINNELKKVCIVDLSFRTDSPEVLDKVMQIGKHPYWVIEMKLFDKLDLENIRSNAEDMGTTTGGSRNASMSFKILTIDEKNDNNISIAKATIRGSLDYEDNEYILRLIYDGLKKNGFYRAQEFLTKDNVLSIIYRTINAPKIRELISKATSMPFTSLFDGKTLDGWKMAGDGRFTIVKSDAALQSEGGMGLLWYTRNIYRNFILKLDWKVSDEGDNSGVFVRFPDPNNNPYNAIREGYEIQIDDGANNPIHQTGAIYDFAAPIKIVSKPPGQWNTMEIQAQDQSYTVIINGHRVTEFTGSRMTEGHVGLQAHDDKSKVSFRNIAIIEINL